MQEVKETIKGAKNAIILSHVDPDGDAVGSMIAFYLALKAMGKKAVMCSADPVPEIYKFLPESGKIKADINGGKYDLAIVLDCGDGKRVGKDVDLKSLAEIVINIDHHPDNTNFGDVNMVEPVSSVSEIIYRLFRKMRVKITRR